MFEEDMLNGGFSIPPAEEELEMVFFGKKETH